MTKRIPLITCTLIIIIFKFIACTGSNRKQFRYKFTFSTDGHNTRTSLVFCQIFRS